MPLSIRNAKVEKLARLRAAEHKMSVTAVIGAALETMPPMKTQSFVEIAKELSSELARIGTRRNRPLSKDEINSEWMD